MPSQVPRRLQRPRGRQGTQRRHWPPPAARSEQQGALRGEPGASWPRGQGALEQSTGQTLTADTPPASQASVPKCLLQDPGSDGGGSRSSHHQEVGWGGPVAQAKLLASSPILSLQCQHLPWVLKPSRPLKGECGRLECSELRIFFLALHYHLGEVRSGSEIPPCGSTAGSVCSYPLTGPLLPAAEFFPLLQLLQPFSCPIE